jgi:hypothetical protein
MTVKRGLAAALIALAALPATASAGALVFPPAHDDYLRAKLVNAEDAPLKVNDPVAFVADTTSYTVQADMFNPDSQGNPAAAARSSPPSAATAPTARRSGRPSTPTGTGG